MHRGGSGCAWIPTWKSRYGSLGTLRETLQRCPERFCVSPAEGRAFTVKLVGDGLDASKCASGRQGDRGHSGGRDFKQNAWNNGVRDVLKTSTRLGDKEWPKPVRAEAKGRTPTWQVKGGNPVRAAAVATVVHKASGVAVGVQQACAGAEHLPQFGWMLMVGALTMLSVIAAVVVFLSYDELRASAGRVRELEAEEQRYVDNSHIMRNGCDGSVYARQQWSVECVEQRLCGPRVATCVAR